MAPMLSLQLFGGILLKDGDGLVNGPASHRHRLALLALLAAHREGLSRDKLLAYLWPERDARSGRSLLKQGVHVLRRALRDDAILAAGDELLLNAEVVRTDLIEFEEAIAAGDPARAVQLYRGPFLDGFFLRRAAEFERWVDRERARLADAYAAVLEGLAEEAEAGGDYARASVSWKTRAAHDALDSRIALRLIRALDASGNRGAALQHAANHEQLLRGELGVEPPPELRAMIERLRREPGRAPLPPASLAPDIPALPRAPLLVRAKPVSRRRRMVLVLTLVALATAASAAWWGDRHVSSQSAKRAGEVSRSMPRTIAVLPFDNVDRRADDEYISEGLTQELTRALSRLKSVRVVSRASALSYRGDRRDLRALGHALKVGTVLAGAVQNSGARLRVRARLVNVADGGELWSETYDLSATDLTSVQHDIALRIATALELELTPGERDRLGRPGTRSQEALTLYLRGRYFANQRTPTGYRRAITYFERAIATDTAYAAPWTGLAAVYSQQGMAGQISPQDARQRTRAATLRAVALDDSLPETHAVLGSYLHVFDWDSEGAEREFRHAIELDPNSAIARYYYGNLLRTVGRLDEAVAQQVTAIELDPLVPAFSETLAFTLLCAGRTDEALTRVRTGLELDSTYWRAHAVLGYAFEVTDHYVDAIREYERANQLAGPSAHRTTGDVVRVLARIGRQREARRLLATLQASAARENIYEPAVATAFHELGDDAKAFDWLEHAFRQRHPSLRFLPCDLRFGSMSVDPRFLDLLRRLRLPG